MSDPPWRDCGVNVCGADFFARNGSGRCAQRRGRQPTGKASYSIASYSLACGVEDTAHPWHRHAPCVGLVPSVCCPPAIR